MSSTAVVRNLEDLYKHGGLKGTDIANFVNVSRPTVSRWSSGISTPPIRTQTIIADLRYVVDRLSDLYAPDEIRLWLYAKQPLLNHQRAVDLILDDRSEEVLTLIERLDAGAYL